ncbi:MAG: hypothetical protein J3Q66DRAFT_82668 [Benniella sp.]|nr:MAG: hypothetical protein J3Q66DRAFT_82668 [Benniella sp.]
MHRLVLPCSSVLSPLCAQSRRDRFPYSRVSISGCVVHVQARDTSYLPFWNAGGSWDRLDLAEGRQQRGQTSAKDTGIARAPCRKRISSKVMDEMWDDFLSHRPEQKTCEDLQTRLEGAHSPFPVPTRCSRTASELYLPLRKFGLVAVPTTVEDEISSSF